MTQEMTEFQQRAAAAAVTKMLQAKHFSICDLQAVAKTMGREQSLAGRDYAALQSLHCVDWVDMGPDLARMTREKCFELLGLPAVTVEAAVPRNNEKPADQARRLTLAFWKKA